MLVNDWMNSPVITIDVEESMQRAVEVMTHNKIGMLPVMDKGKMVGIVTDRDLKRAGPSHVALLEIKQILYHMARVKMEGIMTLDPITVSPDYTIEEAAQVLLDNNISGCPVRDRDGDLCGIITKNDIFRAMVTVSGLTKRGVQFGFMLGDRPGSIKEVTDIIRAYHARLVSIMTTYAKAPQGSRFCYIRAFNVNRERLQELKEELAKKAKLLYVIDIRDNVRETYADY